ncbi:MAG: hypothetical protein WDM76_19495 [Limisphaerales bacterium]
MKKFFYLLFSLLAGLLVSGGCASGTHIVTGNQHPPVPADAVVLYQAPPAKYEIVGIVNATVRGNRQRRMDAATHVLKRQAAKVGANGIILNPVESAGLTGRKTKLSGQAIYVLP